MTTNSARSYNCKDEELPIVCKFAVFSLKRDLADFTAYYPRFNQEYANGFEAKITAVTEVLEPKSETKLLKTITEHLYSNMDALVSPINHLSGYIDLANGTLKLSPSDFGLTDLRKGINKKDAESVIKNLHTVNTNIMKYKEILTPQGLGDALIVRFETAYTTIAADKQTKYEITSNRKSIVQNNLSLLNGLNDQLSEILKIGKILYKPGDEAKMKEYTFTQMMKQVRRSSKNNGDTPISEAAIGKIPEPTN